MRGPLLAVLASVALALPAEAQRGWRVEGGAVVYRPEQTVRHAGGTERQSGVWMGGEGAVQLGALRIAGVGLFGSLGASTGGTAPQTDVRVTAISLAGLATQWLTLHAEGEARRTDDGAVATVRRLIGAGGSLSLGMGVEGLRGMVRATYFPVTVMSAGPPVSLALRGVAEVSYAPRGRALAYRIAYRFERYDYAKGESGTQRLEQVRGLEIGARLRVGP